MCPKAALANGSRREQMPGLENAVMSVLRCGALVSTTLIAVGILLFVFDSGKLGQPMVGSQAVRPAVSVLLSAQDGGSATAVINLGLLALILTPVLRVASTVVYSLRKRDCTYLAITTYVLMVLVAGFAIGAEG